MCISMHGGKIIKSFETDKEKGGKICTLRKKVYLCSVKTSVLAIRAEFRGGRTAPTPPILKVAFESDFFSLPIEFLDEGLYKLCSANRLSGNRNQLALFENQDFHPLRIFGKVSHDILCQPAGIVTNNHIEQDVVALPNRFMKSVPDRSLAIYCFQVIKTILSFTF